MMSAAVPSLLTSYPHIITTQCLLHGLHNTVFHTMFSKQVDTGKKIQVTYGRRSLRPTPPVCCHRGGGQAFTRSAHNIVPNIQLHSLRPPPVVGLHRIARTARVALPPTTPQLAPSGAQTHRDTMQLKFHLDDATRWCNSSQLTDTFVSRLTLHHLCCVLFADIDEHYLPRSCDTRAELWRGAV